MEQTNASEEIIIQEIAMEVESEFQLGGLSDGLYFTFAAEVAKRYASIAVSKERERRDAQIIEFINSGEPAPWNDTGWSVELSDVEKFIKNTK